MTPAEVVSQFLAWYGPNQSRLHSMPLVPAWLTETGDSTKIYRVDFRAADNFLAVFRSSGFVSDNYLANERHEIQKADSSMQTERQYVGPPTGLNYDRIVFSQDPNADLEKLRRTIPRVELRGDTARLLFAQLPKPADLREGADLEFSLVRQQGRWLIDNIRPLFAQ